MKMTHRNGSIFLDCLLLHIWRWLYWLWLTAFLLESFPQPYAKVLIMPKNQKVLYGSYKHNNENFEKSIRLLLPIVRCIVFYMAMFLWLMYRVLSVGFSWKILVANNNDKDSKRHEIVHFLYHWPKVFLWHCDLLDIFRYVPWNCLQDARRKGTSRHIFDELNSC